MVVAVTVAVNLIATVCGCDCDLGWLLCFGAAVTAVIETTDGNTRGCNGRSSCDGRGERGAAVVT